MDEIKQLSEKTGLSEEDVKRALDILLRISNSQEIIDTQNKIIGELKTENELLKKEKNNGRF